MLQKYNSICSSQRTRIDWSIVILRKFKPETSVESEFRKKIAKIQFKKIAKNEASKPTVCFVIDIQITSNSSLESKES